MAAREVLKPIYKYPKRNPRQLHSKRKIRLSTTINSILVVLRDLGLVDSENGEYTITPLGIESIKEIESRSMGEKST